MGLARYAQSTNTSFQYLCDIFRKKLKVKLIFYVPLNIKVFRTGMPKLPKITSLQYLQNGFFIINWDSLHARLNSHRKA